MSASTKPLNGFLDRQLVHVTAGGEGQFTAQVVGLPEIMATAGSREEALSLVRGLLRIWFESGRLAMVEVPLESNIWQGFGHADANDPLEREYLAELARARQEDQERTLGESP
jgi:predicted RNase H-like HicB family nuclease